MTNWITTDHPFAFKVEAPITLAVEIEVLIQSREGMEREMSHETDPERLVRLAIIRDEMNKVILKYL